MLGSSIHDNGSLEIFLKNIGWKFSTLIDGDLMNKFRVLCIYVCQSLLFIGTWQYRRLNP